MPHYLNVDSKPRRASNRHPLNTPQIHVFLAGKAQGRNSRDFLPGKNGLRYGRFDASQGRRIDAP
eukprot:6174634-Alexandrium_andersonii.AAC.1